MQRSTDTSRRGSQGILSGFRVNPGPVAVRSFPRTARRSHHRRRLLLERLEDRTLLSTYTVNSTLDDGSSGTLRWAITQANTVVTPGVPNTIDFNLPSSSTINLESALPNLSATNITIDGPGASSLIVERDPTLPGKTEFSVFTVNNGATVSISGLDRQFAFGYT